MFLKMALLSMKKHYKRTILILAAVAMSVLVMQFMGGMFEGMRDSFFGNLTTDSGHIQIHANGWKESLDKFSLDHMVTSPEKLIEELSSVDGIVRAEKVMIFGALLLNEERNVAIGGHGIEPETEFFSNIKEGIIAGDFDVSNGILISKRIAELLQVSQGQPLLVLTEDSSGSPYYLEFPVTGVFESGSKETDENVFFLSHSAAEELLYLDDSTTEIRMVVEEADSATQIVGTIKELAESMKQELEIEDWREIHGTMILFIEMFDIIIVFMNLLIIVVAASVITNAILMNVFERIREFGTLRAIGLKKRQLFSIILTEGAVQGSLGSLAGLIIAIPLVLFYQKTGMNFGDISELMVAGSRLYFKLSPVNVFVNLISGIAIALAGSIYAAFVSNRMSVYESLNYV